MEFFVILTAWLLLQWRGPGSALHRDQWLHYWYLRAGDALGALPVTVRLLLVLLLPALLIALLTLLVKPLLGGVALFALELLVLTYALGRGDFNAQLDAYLERWQRGDLEAAYREALRSGTLHAQTAARSDRAAPEQTEAVAVDSTHIDDGAALHREMCAAVAYSGFERWFAVVFWFAALGPAAALFYRLLQLLSRNGNDSHLSAAENVLIARWLFWAEWLPARLLGLAFAVTGNFAACFRRWRERLFETEPTPALLAGYVGQALEVMAPAMRAAVQPSNRPLFIATAAVELNELRDLLRRSAICWLVALALLQLIG